ncbi:MAG: DNA polymerase/3'-5' exonuclease PolX [Planctomycetales bacterium]|nr:DNA polymerase/3'-5' exonuclease PolX [Planctomycetales bacterium]
MADEFETLADLLEFQGANSFRVRAYRNAARVIRGWLQPLSSRLADPTFDPTSIEGIGEAVGEKMRALVLDGAIPQLEELRRQLPDGVLDLLRVPGLGPKKAATLFQELKIDSLDKLEQACQNQELRKLKGFGAKTETTILEGLSIARSSQQRLLRSDAEAIACRLRDHLDGVAHEKLEFAGSLRRGRETVGDLDLIVVAPDGAAVMDRLAEFDDVREVIARGETKMSVRLRNGFQIDLRVVPDESFGSALQYFTGSMAHNVKVRAHAKQLGLKINEWGVFRVEGESETWIAGRTEADVYEAIGWPWFPPELREARLEFQDSRPAELPPLIELSDLRGDLHMHTTATDGTASIEEMARGAYDLGLRYIVISDHSQRVAMARGLDEERLLAQWREVDELDRAWSQELGFRILKGIECDILEDGTMDLSDEVLAQADWVTASIHYGQNQPREQITERMLNAVRHPSVDVIAHPTGRLLLRREPYEVDLPAVMQACVEHGKALELNANPHRLDLDDVQVARCAELGIPVTISSDAHSVSGLTVLRCGVIQARRGGLTANDVLNTRDADGFIAWKRNRR